MQQASLQATSEMQEDAGDRDKQPLQVSSSMQQTAVGQISRPGLLLTEQQMFLLLSIHYMLQGALLPPCSASEVRGRLQRPHTRGPAGRSVARRGTRPRAARTAAGDSWGPPADHCPASVDPCKDHMRHG